MENIYNILQHYWWLVISLLGSFLVFLLFVQGGQSLLFTLGKTEVQQKMLLNSTGRKWEITFTTLVTFGGAFFASFPLFYSTSFGGAYWVWMLILICFVLQAVSYEYQSKKRKFVRKKDLSDISHNQRSTRPYFIRNCSRNLFQWSRIFCKQRTTYPVIHAGYLQLGNSMAWPGSCLGYMESLFRICIIFPFPNLSDSLFH